MHARRIALRSLLKSPALAVVALLAVAAAAQVAIISARPARHRPATGSEHDVTKPILVNMLPTLGASLKL
ncbi:MAG TPA: hypothetical protein VG734_15070 [Lacunisphaera sp.]|nr:hypothetical protein [Lacunisphaera sp.]